MAEGGGDGDWAYRAKLPELRQRFNDKYSDNIEKDIYAAEDLEQFKSNDLFAHHYLVAKQGVVEDAIKQVDGSLKWRKEFGVADIKEKDFPIEFLDVGAIYFHSHDKDNNEIFYLCLQKNENKTSEARVLIKKYIGYKLEQYYWNNPGKRIVCLMDLYGSKMKNFDMDLLRFVVTSFTVNYPGFLAYMIIYDMPFLFNAIWRIVKGWLSQAQQERVKFSTKKDIQEFINKEMLWEHMGGTDSFEYKYSPPMRDALEETDSNDMASTPSTPGTPSTSDPTDTSTQSAPLPNGLGPMSDHTRKKVTFAEQETLYLSFNSENDGKHKETTKSSSKKNKQRTDSRSLGNILTISPPGILEFDVVDPNKESLAVITLTNISPKQVLFKVKTTTPENYRVRPSSGIIEAGSSTEVNVYLLPVVLLSNRGAYWADPDPSIYTGNNWNVNRDKFLVMAMQMPEDTNDSDTVAIWRTTSRKFILEHRLRCTLNATPVEEELPENCQKLQSDIKALTKKVDAMLDQNKELQTKVNSINRGGNLLIFLVGMVLAFVVYFHLLMYPGTPLDNVCSRIFG